MKSGKGGTQSKEREELSPEELEERRQKRREEHLGFILCLVSTMGGHHVWDCFERFVLVTAAPPLFPTTG